MTLDNLSKAAIKHIIETQGFEMQELTYDNLATALNGKPATEKLGRQGYALVLGKDFTGKWYWSIETQNGKIVAESYGSYSRRWDAVRAAKRLSDKIVHFYVEDANGFRSAL